MRTELRREISIGGLKINPREKKYLAQVKEKIIRARQSIAGSLTRALSDLQDVIQLPSKPSDRDHMFMLYPIIVRQGEKRALVNYLEERGIETRDLMPLINQPVYTKLYGDLESRYPVARWINHCGFYVGCHQYMTGADVAYLSRQLHAFFGK
jgi:dTDP-4-amino-4,6-dideoxygalactose transaminase